MTIESHKHHAQCFCLALLVLIALAPGVFADSPTQLQEIDVQIKDLNSALASDKARRDSLTKQLAESEKNIGRLGKNIFTLKNEQSDFDQQLANLAHEQRKLRKELSQHRQSLQQILQSAYSSGRQEQLKLLLNQQNPAMMNRMMTYYSLLNRQRIALIQQTRSVLAQLENTSLQIEIARQQLQDNLRQQAGQLADLEKEQSKRKALRLNLEKDIQSKQQLLSQLQQDRKALEKIVDRINRQQQAKQQERQTPVNKLKGKLPWPVAGIINHRFGTQRTADLNWDGVLISTTAGTEVRAIHYGRVVYADWLRGYGLMMIIDHGDGVMSLYGHNQSLFKEVGEWIDKHDVIAAVGNSGGLQDYGLYFSIRKKGTPDNPKRWCKKIRNNKTSI